MSTATLSPPAESATDGYPAKRRLITYRQDDDPTTYSESDAVENVPELPGFRCVVADFFV